MPAISRSSKKIIMLLFRIFQKVKGRQITAGGNFLRADNLDFSLKRVEYTEDGKRCGKIIMPLYGWEKA